MDDHDSNGASFSCPVWCARPPPFTPTQPHNISALIADRYIRLLWYQWFTPEPMMTMHLPLVSRAVSPHSLAKRISVSRLMPVYFSCHAGVKGAFSSS